MHLFSVRCLCNSSILYGNKGSEQVWLLMRDYSSIWLQHGYILAQFSLSGNFPEKKQLSPSFFASPDFCTAIWIGVVVVAGVGVDLVVRLVVVVVDLPSPIYLIISNK
jgi:hypothetical protein